MHKATPELVAKARKLRAEGNSFGVISVRLGVSYCAIRCWLDEDYRDRHNKIVARSQARRRAKIRTSAEPKRRVKYDPEVVEKARKLHDLGVPVARIAKKQGIHAQTLRRWLDPNFALRPEGKGPSEAYSATVGVSWECRDRIRAEAKRRGISVRALVSELIERGLPRSFPEAAE